MKLHKKKIANIDSCCFTKLHRFLVFHAACFANPIIQALFCTDIGCQCFTLLANLCTHTICQKNVNPPASPFSIEHLGERQEIGNNCIHEFRRGGEMSRIL